jgi:E3 ubiquitin-protein ligase RNF213
MNSEYNDFLRRLNPDKGIARNFALKENIFAIFTSIINKIPIFITGCPGQSKTLSMSLLLNGMKLREAKDEYLKTVPLINSLFF